jgi:hypothetical protein
VSDDDDTTPKDKHPVIVEIVRPARHPVTLDVLNRTIHEHAEDDAKAFGAISVELTHVRGIAEGARKEQATKSGTNLQTAVIGLLLAITALIHQCA